MKRKKMKKWNNMTKSKRGERKRSILRWLVQLPQTYSFKGARGKWNWDREKKKISYTTKHVTKLHHNTLPSIQPTHLRHWRRRTTTTAKRQITIIMKEKKKLHIVSILIVTELLRFKRLHIKKMYRELPPRFEWQPTMRRRRITKQKKNKPWKEASALLEFTAN